MSEDVKRALIEKLRTQIDQTDIEIIIKVLERMTLAGIIRNLKQEIGLPARDLERENEIINSYEDLLGQVGIDVITAMLPQE